MHPGGSQDGTDAGGFLAARCGSGENSTREFWEGGAGRREDGVWDGCGCLRLWDEWKAVCVHGEVRDDADAVASGGDFECGGFGVACEQEGMDLGEERCPVDFG